MEWSAGRPHPAFLLPLLLLLLLLIFKLLTALTPNFVRPCFVAPSEEVTSPRLTQCTAAPICLTQCMLCSLCKLHANSMQSPLRAVSEPITACVCVCVL